MVRLPPAPSGGVVDDEAVVEWLAKEHGVCVIPGTACGTPGQVRVCFANLPPVPSIVSPPYITLYLLPALATLFAACCWPLRRVWRLGPVGLG